MEKKVLIIDDKATQRDDVKWAANKSIPSVETIEAPDKDTAIRSIREFRDQIFAVVCDGDLGDGNPFGGLEILDLAREVGIKHLIFFASLADSVPPKMKSEGVHYTNDLNEVSRLLKAAADMDN